MSNFSASMQNVEYAYQEYSGDFAESLAKLEYNWPVSHDKHDYIDGYLLSIMKHLPYPHKFQIIADCLALGNYSRSFCRLFTISPLFNPAIHMEDYFNGLFIKACEKCYLDIIQIIWERVQIDQINKKIGLLKLLETKEFSFKKMDIVVSILYFVPEATNKFIDFAIRENKLAYSIGRILISENWSSIDYILSQKIINKNHPVLNLAFIYKDGYEDDLKNGLLFAIENKLENVIGLYFHHAYDKRIQAILHDQFIKFAREI